MSGVNPQGVYVFCMEPPRSRLGESNPGPTHYECVALTD
jgi:hypothetical protein